MITILHFDDDRSYTLRAKFRIKETDNVFHCPVNDLNMALCALEEISPDVVCTDWNIENDINHETSEDLILLAIERGIPVVVRTNLPDTANDGIIAYFNMKLGDKRKLLLWLGDWSDKSYDKLSEFPALEIEHLIRRKAHPEQE